jgi:hypothetical protein
VIKVLEDAEPPFTDPPRRTFETAGEFEEISRSVLKCAACGETFANPY